MNEQPPLDPTVDLPPSGDSFDAAFAAAFGPDSGSVLKALSAGLPSVPRILLREPESFGGSPIVRPSSEEMPDKQDPAARLQLHGEIARGGMGAVLKGRDMDLGRDVAVKVLLETHQGKTELMQRFIEEAQISGQLQHPGIAPVYELGQFVDKRPYFTMKLVKGKTLATLLAARKTPDEERTRYVGIFAQICQTLAYAHARGVIHRDLKPGNVMVGAFGEVQVMDWGLAKVLKEGGIADELKARQQAEVSVIRTQRSEGSASAEVGSDTQAGTVLGTPAYMAPEQARGDVDLVDERSDVFGLGAILCEILIGKPPYEGRTAEAHFKARKAKLEDVFARMDASGADAELIALTKHCLRAEKWERPRHAGEVAEQVTAYQQSVTERLRQTELARAAEEGRAIEARATAVQERRARRMTLALAASVLLTMLLGGSGWLWLRSQREARLVENTRAVNEAITQAATLGEKARAAQGKAALTLATQAREQAQRADALVQRGSADTALATKVRQLVAELEADEKDARLLVTLDAARLAQTETISENRFASEPAVPLFREAFRVYGMAAGEGEGAAVAAQLSKRPAAVREAVLAALEEWISLAEDARLKIEEPHLAWLRAVQAAESEDWVKQIPEAAATKDPAKRRAALERLAATADVEHLPARALTRLATHLRSVRAEASALALLRRAQPQHAGDFWINENLGIALGKKQSADAVRYLTAAVALRPDSAGAHYNLGNVLADQGKWDEAIAEYKKAIDLDPKYAAAHCNLGSALKGQGKQAEAISEYKKAIELEPKNAAAHNNLGGVLKAQGKQDEAISEYKKAIELDPKLATARYNLGHALAAQGKPNEAMSEYKKAIELNPKLAQPHAGLGHALAAQGKPNEAMSEYKKAIELDPKYAPAHNNLGAALATQGKQAEAIAEYKKSIELDPKYAPAHNNLGGALEAQGKQDEAMSEYKKAIELDPKLSRSHAGLGHALAAQGKRDEAIAEFRKALELDPNDALAHINLGYSLSHLGRFAEAAAAFKRGHELGSHQPGWRYPSAQWLRNAEQKAALAANLPALLRGDYQPRDNADRLGLAEVCLSTKHYAAAARLYTDAFAAEPKRADDLKAAHRYNAARAAALAGCGRGEDAKELDDKQRARWRKQALDWLRADLALRSKQADSDKPADRQAVQNALRHWQRDADLSGLRDKDAIAKLPAQERQACEKLWADVAALLKKVQAAK